MADGTPCGPNQACQSGVCQCGGVACAPADVCDLGTTTCDGGSACVDLEQIDPAQLGRSCAGTGTCTDAGCTCGPKQALSNGSCTACPATSGSDVYVSADPTKGQDNACCGWSATPGLGGPCLTLSQAVANAGGSTGVTIHLSGDANGNASSTESYPIHLGGSITLTSDSKFCLPGVPGANVINVDVDTTTVIIGSGAGSFTIGFTCSGTPGGAIDAIYVGPRNTPGGPAVTYATLQGLTLGGTQTGLEIMDSTVTASGITIQQSVTGVSCNSSSQALTPVPTLTIPSGQTLAVSQASTVDIATGGSCHIQGAVQLGATPPCPATKVDLIGITAIGFSALNLTGSIACMQNHGISVGTNIINTNASQVTFANGSISHCGGAGVFLGQGSVAVTGVTFTHNHYGIEYSGGTLSATGDTFSCSTNQEPGVDCQGTFCPPGADIFNESAGNLTAENDTWDVSPPAACTCSSKSATLAPTGCTCTGFAAGQTTAPDGVGIINLPATGQVLTTGSQQLSPSSGCP